MLMDEDLEQLVCNLHGYQLLSPMNTVQISSDLIYC